MRITINSEIFTRGVEDIITRDELKRLLSSGRRLRVKHGIDATAPDLHIGHASNLWKLRALQQAGHKAVILLGDTTTLIGDPTGKSKARPELSWREIEGHIKQIRKQIGAILLPGKRVLEVHRSSEWYNRMTTPQFLRILAAVTHARLIERDMFRQRIKKGAEIFAHELIYPILQGYDSVMLKSDLTVIGSDQLFNEHLGRLLQEKFGHKPQVIVTLKILPGLGGGEKMSKTLENYIGLSDSPRDKFGKAMRLADSLIVPYLDIYTDVSRDEVGRRERELRRGKNPMEAKLFFAEALVRRYHGQAAARQERGNFLRVFSRREPPANLPEVTLRYGAWKPVELLVRIDPASSKSEARRLIRQGAVEVDGKVIRDFHAPVNIRRGLIIKVGRRKFLRVK